MSADAGRPDKNSKMRGSSASCYNINHSWLDTFKMNLHSTERRSKVLCKTYVPLHNKAITTLPKLELWSPQNLGVIETMFNYSIFMYWFYNNYYNSIVIKTFIGRRGITVTCLTFLPEMREPNKPKGQISELLERVHSYFWHLSHSMGTLHGCAARSTFSRALRISFCRNFCFSAFFRWPVFFLGIFSIQLLT